MTLQETFEVTLQVMGRRAASFQIPAGVSSFLPGFGRATDVVDRAGYTPLLVTMSHGDDLVAAVTARATGKHWA